MPMLHIGRITKIFRDILNFYLPIYGHKQRLSSLHSHLGFYIQILKERNLIYSEGFCDLLTKTYINIYYITFLAQLFLSF